MRMRIDTAHRECGLGPLDALWHGLNFFAPAVGVALLACLMAKLCWRSALRGSSLQSLWAWSAGAGALALLAGLLVFGRDGRMATYGLLVLSVAAVLSWRMAGKA